MFHVHVLLIFFIILIAIISHHWINAIFFSEGDGIISSFKGHGHAGLHVSRASSLPTSLSTSNRSRVWPFREEVLRRIFQLLWHIVPHGALHDRCSSTKSTPYPSEISVMRACHQAYHYSGIIIGSSRKLTLLNGNHVLLPK